mgnify:CR=1 FL=1
MLRDDGLDRADELDEFAAAELLAVGTGPKKIARGTAVRLVLALRHLDHKQVFPIMLERRQADGDGRVAVAGEVLHLGKQTVADRNAPDFLFVRHAHIDASAGGVGERREFPRQGI